MPAALAKVQVSVPGRVSGALLHWRKTALRAPPRDAEWAICRAPFDPRWRVCLLQAPRVEPVTCPICVQRNSAPAATSTPGPASTTSAPSWDGALTLPASHARDAGESASSVPPTPGNDPTSLAPHYTIQVPDTLTHAVANPRRRPDARELATCPWVRPRPTRAVGSEKKPNRDGRARLGRSASLLRVPAHSRRITDVSPIATTVASIQPMIESVHSIADSQPGASPAGCQASR
jgi:hypothetical protein